MEAFFSWLGVGFGALFVVAVAVAWWEHLVRSSRPTAPVPPHAPRAVNVDVRLDTQAGALYASEAVERRAVVDSAMGRMGRVGVAARSDSARSDHPDAWSATSPMVLHPPAPGEDQPNNTPASRA